MNINECIEQLNSLLEHFENGGNDFNATDVIAIKSLLEENKQLKAELKNKPDTEITLRDDKGNEFLLIQTERIDMQERLNKTIQRLFDNWNKLKEYINIKLYNTEYLQRLCGCKIDDETHMILDIIKEEMRKLEQRSESDE